MIKKIPKVEVRQVKPTSPFVAQPDLDKKLVFSLAKKRFPNWQQLQYIREYLSKTERLVIRITLGLIIVALGFLTVKFYLRHIVYLPKDGGSYSEAVVGQPAYINPILAQSDVDRDLARLVYSGLFRYDQNFNPVPDLADHYEMSEDQKVYTVYLRQNLKWQNGNDLLADDIVYTYETVKDSGYNSPLRTNYAYVNVERVDDHTVKFSLTQPSSLFLSSLTLGILPAHLWSDLNPSSFRLAEYNTKPIGSGPYSFKELSKDKSGILKTYTLAANGQYYGTKPHLSQITFRLYESFDSAIAAAQNNSVDGVSYVPKGLKATLQKNDSISIHSFHLPQYAAVFFNMKNGLFKNNKEVRQALATATNKEDILSQALDNDGMIVDGPILEGFPGYNKDLKKYNFNIAQAREILENAGWKFPEGKTIRQKNNLDFKFSITTVDQPEYTKTAELLKKSWEDIGASVEIKTVSAANVDKDVIKPRNYDVFLYGEILGYDPDPFPFWHSSQSTVSGLNLSNYYNKDVDKILEDARKLTNQEEIAKKYSDFQNILAEDIPAIFLYSPSYDYGVNHRVKGITQERIAIPSDRFNGIEDWYIKTKLGWK